LATAARAGDDRIIVRMPKATDASCAICHLADRRGLVETCLPNGASAVLCGTHAVMLRRLTQDTTASRVSRLRGIDALRDAFGDRRRGDRRRGDSTSGASLERRGIDRRAP